MTQHEQAAKISLIMGRRKEAASKDAERREEYALIRRAQKGDKEAIAILVERFHRFLWKCAVSVSCFEDKEDLFQIACVEFIEALSRFKFKYKVRLMTFMYGVVAKRMWLHAKTSGLVRVPAYQDSETRAAAIPLAISGTQENGSTDQAENCFLADDDTLQVETNEQLRRMQAAIETLTPRQQRVIQGRLEGLTLDEINREYSWGLTRERVRQIGEGALERLRELLGAKLPDKDGPVHQRTGKIFRPVKRRRKRAIPA